MVDKELVDHLDQFITPNRRALFERILAQRTNYATVALENIFQPQNASAVLRTADCFGVQDVHIIENSNQYHINPDVALGSSKWVTMHHYNQKPNNTPEALAKLKADGYRIVATTPHTNDVDLENFDITKGKFALFFGTELDGLTDHVLDQADEYLKIPMYGFTESFNISVSAAIILNSLTEKIRTSKLNWALSDQRKLELRLDWMRKTITRVEAYEKEFYKRKNTK